MASKCPGTPHRGHASTDWTCPLEQPDTERYERAAATFHMSSSLYPRPDLVVALAEDPRFRAAIDQACADHSNRIATRIRTMNAAKAWEIAAMIVEGDI